LCGECIVEEKLMKGADDEKVIGFGFGFWNGLGG
jgi:hypothetical protein